MHALEEGVVANAGDLDLAMVLGTGFPPFRGGVLRWADSRGARAIQDRLASFEQALGARFAAAPGLVELAEREGSFTDL